MKRFLYIIPVWAWEQWAYNSHTRSDFLVSIAIGICGREAEIPINKRIRWPISRH